MNQSILSNKEWHTSRSKVNISGSHNQSLKRRDLRCRKKRWKEEGRSKRSMVDRYRCQYLHINNLIRGNIHLR